MRTFVSVGRIWDGRDGLIFYEIVVPIQINRRRTKRLPVKTLEEAKNIVDKIIYYDTHKKAYGKWRKDIAFVGDDGNNTDNFTSSHQSQANTMAESIELLHPEFDTKKNIFRNLHQNRSA